MISIILQLPFWSKNAICRVILTKYQKLRPSNFIHNDTRILRFNNRRDNDELKAWRICLKNPFARSSRCDVL